MKLARFAEALIAGAEYQKIALRGYNRAFGQNVFARLGNIIAYAAAGHINFRVGCVIKLYPVAVIAV